MELILKSDRMTTGQFMPVNQPYEKKKKNQPFVCPVVLFTTVMAGVIQAQPDSTILYISYEVKVKFINDHVMPVYLELSFLSCSAMHKHGLCCHVVSVRLSVRHVYVFCQSE